MTDSSAQTGTTSTRSRLIVLAGPTAVGKGTVSAYVREHYPQAWLSVSATTRPARPGEEDGVHYYFTTPEEFDSLVAADEMLAAWGRGDSSLLP